METKKFYCPSLLLRLMLPTITLDSLIEYDIYNSTQKRRYQEINLE